MFDDQLGEWLEQQRRKSMWYFKMGLAVLALLVAINVFVGPEHPHFELERIPGFWGVFGLVASVGISLVLKKLVYPLLRREEEADGE